MFGKGIISMKAFLVLSSNVEYLFLERPYCALATGPCTCTGSVI